ncbi:MAG TPA: Ada metal-binding domain-containing protein, partial [Isosphaeraceae bacterium]|nr:Ada metal-binding domain-containing protein [Isosphaeraceae bacterium]
SDPAQRYPNTRALADDLNAWLRRQQGAMRPLHSLACTVLGIAAALLLMVGLKASFAPGDSPRPPVAAPVAPPAPKSEPPAAASRAPVAPPDAHETLVFNRRSKTYHRADCPTLTKGLEENFKPLRDAEEAVKMGYRPCSVCRPPISQSRGTTGAEPGSP